MEPGAERGLGRKGARGGKGPGEPAGSIRTLRGGRRRVPKVTEIDCGPEYCDHQENRKSVIGRDHLRVPSGVPLPAAGLSAASGLSLESTQRGTTASQRAECSEWTVYQPMG